MSKFFEGMYDGAVLLHKLWEYDSILRFRAKRLHKYKVNKLKGITITPSKSIKPINTPKIEIKQELPSSGKRYKDVLYVRYISNSSGSWFTKGKVYEVFNNTMYEYIKSHYINFIADNGQKCCREWRDSKGEPTFDQKDFIEATKEEYVKQNLPEKRSEVSVKKEDQYSVGEPFSGYPINLLASATSFGLIHMKEKDYVDIGRYDKVDKDGYIVKVSSIGLGRVMVKVSRFGIEEQLVLEENSASNIQAGVMTLKSRIQRSLRTEVIQLRSRIALDIYNH